MYKLIVITCALLTIGCAGNKPQLVETEPVQKQERYNPHAHYCTRGHEQLNHYTVHNDWDGPYDLEEQLNHFELRDEQIIEVKEESKTDNRLF